MQLPNSSTVRFTKDPAYGGGDYLGQTDASGGLSIGGAIFAYGVNDIYVWQQPGPGDFVVYIIASNGRYRKYAVDIALPQPQHWVLTEKGQATVL